MTITIESLVSLASTMAPSRSEAMHEPLYITFDRERNKVHDTLTYHGVEGSIVAIDVDASGQVLGIEIA